MTVQLSDGTAQGWNIVRLSMGAPPGAPPSDLTVGSASVNAVEGQGFAGTVAGFTYTGTNPATFTALVNWGDGTSSPGTVAGSGSNYTVAGSHSYMEEGSYNLSLTVFETSSTSMGSGTYTWTVSAIAEGLATVVDAPLTLLNGQALVAAANSGFTATLATFSDTSPFALAGDFSVDVLWGDGGSSSGTLSALGGGAWAVLGSHVYAGEGAYAIGIEVADDGGSILTARAAAVVTRFDDKLALQQVVTGTLTGSGTLDPTSGMATVPYVLSETLQELRDSVSLVETGTLVVSLSAELIAGGDDDLVLGNYTVSVTGADTFSRQVAGATLSQQFSHTDTGSDSFAWVQTGDDVTGDYTLTEQATQTALEQGGGSDESGSSLIGGDDSNARDSTGGTWLGDYSLTADVTVSHSLQESGDLHDGTYTGLRVDVTTTTATRHGDRPGTERHRDR